MSATGAAERTRAQHSQALVIFGFTGDLATKIIAALYAMVKKRTLAVPVIGNPESGPAQ